MSIVVFIFTTVTQIPSLKWNFHMDIFQEFPPAVYFKKYIPKLQTTYKACHAKAKIGLNRQYPIKETITLFPEQTACLSLLLNKLLCKLHEQQL